ncbi:hypothetical protein CSUB01_00852 [Colletotrichum sublineola]|uniref:Uncharacterized protein n=1 Tax=Colletotrichum sublineola TaxID=1173701 RepID=A0A066WZM9_COLSU|nr:hypothetical protein CSUB01_00852 [Colletotrichum sublineola]
MSEKQPVSKWNNPAFLHSLMLALYDQLKGSLSKEVKDAVEQKMHRDGFEDITWDAIRIFPPSSLISFHSSSTCTPKMSRATMKWTYEVDQQILVAMVKTMTPTAEQYSAIIQELHTYGYNCTVSALNTHTNIIQYTMGPVTVWDDKARSDLLVALLTVMKPSKEDWDRALAAVHDKGYTYTASAATQHIQKLQRKEQTSGDSGEASITPVKKGAKKAATPRKRKTPVKKAKTESDAEEEEEQATPPPKKPCTPKKPSMKEEADEFLDTEAMDGNRFETNDVEI